MAPVQWSMNLPETVFIIVRVIPAKTEYYVAENTWLIPETTEETTESSDTSLGRDEYAATPAGSISQRSI